MDIKFGFCKFVTFITLLFFVPPIFVGTLVNGSCNGNGDLSPPTKLAKTEFVLNSVNGSHPITLVHQEPLRNLISASATNDANNNAGTNIAQTLGSNTQNSQNSSTNVSNRSSILNSSIVTKPETNIQVAQSNIEEPEGNFEFFGFV